MKNGCGFRAHYQSLSFGYIRLPQLKYYFFVLHLFSYFFFLVFFSSAAIY